MPARRLRRPGSAWIVRVSQYLGAQRGSFDEGRLYGTDYVMTNDLRYGAPPDGWPEENTEELKRLEVPGTEFDSLAVGNWLAVTKTSQHEWQVRVGEVTLTVRPNLDGRPTSVHVTGPGDLNGPVEYKLTWPEDPANDELAARRKPDQPDSVTRVTPETDAA